MSLSATPLGAVLADALQLAATAAAALAAGAAWVAAKATRDTAKATEATARQTQFGHLVELHRARVGVLRDLHRRVSWITEGGIDRTNRPPAEQQAVKMGIEPGTTIVEGVELLGLIVSTGLELPNCVAVAESMGRMKIGGAPIAEAEAEIRAAMESENQALNNLRAEITLGERG